MFASLFNYCLWRLKTANTPKKGYLTCSDTRIYYEIYGKQKSPLLLLHGGLTSVESWYAQLPALSKDFQLIVIDMRGHGRSNIGQQPFSYDLLASDTLAVLDQLHLKQVDIVGWSDGGIVGLKLAITHPERVNKLIAISANYNLQGLTRTAIAAMKHATPSNHSILARFIYYIISPDPKQWQTLWYNVTTMWASYPQITHDELAQIKVNTLFIQGEKDLISLQHFNQMADVTPNSERLIIANTGHNALQQTPQIINQAIIRFLEY
tara:strand:+ start:89460 stop:90254 length:795 start_codon:yes stop_codon:yes gene_type:complete